MRKNKLPLLLLLLAGVASMAFIQHKSAYRSDALIGAWGNTTDGMETVFIFKDGYYTLSCFNKSSKQFLFSRGGTYKVNGNKLHCAIEFDTETKDDIGTEVVLPYKLEGANLVLQEEGEEPMRFKRIDDGKADLSGNWRITGRMQGGQVAEIKKSDRKTLKILSGTRFQWMAINAATKEFFGTGGGTYTFKNGKYVETIEFFSRDSSRVGAVLGFEGKVNGDKWEHSGKSSRGDDIFEIWSREK